MKTMEHIYVLSGLIYVFIALIGVCVIVCMYDRMKRWQIEAEEALRCEKGENKPEEKEDEVKEDVKYSREKWEGGSGGDGSGGDGDEKASLQREGGLNKKRSEEVRKRTMSRTIQA